MANPKIQLRHDTSANWTSVNPTLLEGEVGIETDTKKFKVGDGVTAWTSLAYGNADTEAIEQLEQDYGSLVDKVNTIETDKISFDNLNSPLSIVNNNTSRSIKCDTSSNPIDPVYKADLSYYKIGGTWNYNQAQWSFSHYDDGGDIVLIRVGSNNSQLRINNLPGCQNWEYHQLKITTGGAPDWSLSFTENYKVRFSTGDLEDQIITLPNDIVQYFTSLEDKTFTTNVMLLKDKTATTYINVQELPSKSATLSYDNNTLKVNDSGQLYADVSVPSNMVTTDTVQTITGAKAFTTQQQFTTIKLGKPSFGASGIVYRNTEAVNDSLLLSWLEDRDAPIWIGNSSAKLKIAGSSIELDAQDEIYRLGNYNFSTDDYDHYTIIDTSNLAASIANIALVTNSNGVLYNDGSADFTIVGVDDTQTSVDLGISKSGYYVNMLSSTPLQRNHSETIYDTSMNQQIGQQALPSVSSMQELTLPTSGEAVADLPSTGGYIFWQQQVNAVGGYIRIAIYDNSNNFYYSDAHIPANTDNIFLELFTPIPPNSIVRVLYSGITATPTFFRFIPIQGS